jgi:hypothetical protein
MPLAVRCVGGNTPPYIRSESILTAIFVPAADVAVGCCLALSADRSSLASFFDCQDPDQPMCSDCAGKTHRAGHKVLQVSRCGCWVWCGLLRTGHRRCSAWQQ